MFLRVLVLLGAVAMIYAVHDWLSRPGRDAPAATIATQDSGAVQLVMYGTTTCAPCKVRAAELRAAGVAFTELMIDRDDAARQSLEAKLRVSQPPGTSVGTPIFEVGGELVFGNPTVPELQRLLGSTSGAGKGVSFFRS